VRFVWVAQAVLKLEVVEMKLNPFITVTFKHEVTGAFSWVRLWIQR